MVAAAAVLPQVLFLNGTSSSGKTSVALELQESLGEPFLRVALDHLFDMVPRPWGGGRGGPSSSEGFSYEVSMDGAGLQCTRIRYGHTGRIMLDGLHASVVALVATGNRVLVDTIVLDAEEGERWRAALRHVDLVVVALTAPVRVLEERADQRGQVAGLARGHLDAVDLMAADFTIDTSSGPPERHAADLIEALASRR